MDKKFIYDEIKKAAQKIVPEVRIIIYGSYARNEEHEESDVDIMIIVNQVNLQWELRRKIRYAIYALELKHQVILSPKVLTEAEWNEKKYSSPFFENVITEGIVI